MLRARTDVERRAADEATMLVSFMASENEAVCATDASDKNDRYKHKKTSVMDYGASQRNECGGGATIRERVRLPSLYIKLAC